MKYSDLVLAEREFLLNEYNNFRHRYKNVVNDFGDIGIDYYHLVGGRGSTYYKPSLNEQWVTQNYSIPNMLPKYGFEFWHDQLYVNTSAGTQGANIIALTESTAEPNFDDEVLPSEITDTGLARAASSPAPAHIDFTNVSVIEKTFLPTGSKTPRMLGLYNTLTVSGSKVLQMVKLDAHHTTVNGGALRVILTVTVP